MSYSYVASPYSHELEWMMEERAEAVMKYCAEQFNKGIHVFSPIAHCHEMAKKYNMPKDVGFWWSYNKTMLRFADTLLVLRLSGWDKSKGVAMERNLAAELEIPELLV